MAFNIWIKFKNGEEQEFTDHIVDRIDEGFVYLLDLNSVKGNSSGGVHFPMTDIDEMVNSHAQEVHGG